MNSLLQTTNGDRSAKGMARAEQGGAGLYALPRPNPKGRCALAWPLYAIDRAGGLPTPIFIRKGIGKSADFRHATYAWHSQYLRRTAGSPFSAKNQATVHQESAGWLSSMPLPVR